MGAASRVKVADHSICADGAAHVWGWYHVLRTFQPAYLHRDLDYDNIHIQ